MLTRQNLIWWVFNRDKETWRYHNHTVPPLLCSHCFFLSCFISPILLVPHTAFTLNYFQLRLSIRLFVFLFVYVSSFLARSLKAVVKYQRFCIHCVPFILKKNGQYRIYWYLIAFPLSTFCLITNPTQNSYIIILIKFTDNCLHVKHDLMINHDEAT